MCSLAFTQAAGSLPLNQLQQTDTQTSNHTPPLFVCQDGWKSPLNESGSLQSCDSRCRKNTPKCLTRFCACQSPLLNSHFRSSHSPPWKKETSKYHCHVRCWKKISKCMFWVIGYCTFCTGPKSVDTPRNNTAHSAFFLFPSFSPALWWDNDVLTKAAGVRFYYCLLLMKHDVLFSSQQETKYSCFPVSTF